ncbi:hypothetical protein F0562_019519 [Nyssa sinensis]|uniref:Uncharacterized protein n=1 Tax=Nyssa sinensis TaxID=561372 RepID=A0A5J5BSN5_9ASTE|nr:hypothetical protein F0562_019519 [Nyssa sinensis]
MTQAIHIGFVSLMRVLKLKSDLFIIKTVTSGVEVRHAPKIEVAKVAVVEKYKKYILKLGIRFVSNGYNICLKKLAKAYPKVDTDVLDEIEVKVEAEEDDNEALENLGLPSSA